MCADYTFPKAVRLLTTSDYSQVFDDVKLRVSSQNFLILAREQTSPLNRLGIIAAKKNVKLAVQRNRLKRLLRESFRNERSTLPEFDMVVLVKKNADKFSNDIIFDELNYLWRKFRRKALE